MDEIPALVGDVTPGDAVTLSDVSGARLGTFICFEALRPEIAREMKMHGASVLVQISNEAWFGPSAAPRQIMAHAIFRAVENNVDLVRATNSGLSARINRYGRVEGLTSQFETAIRNWNVESVEEAKSFPATFYTRYGDVFAVGCVVLTGLLAAASLIRPKAKES
jgi:apolipoprotein N-acyltransferase